MSSPEQPAALTALLMQAVYGEVWLVCVLVGHLLGGPEATYGALGLARDILGQGGTGGGEEEDGGLHCGWSEWLR
jgi:hypothetical protein